MKDDNAGKKSGRIKSFFRVLFDKLDKKMKDNAQGKSYCCGPSDKGKGSCCS